MIRSLSKEAKKYSFKKFVQKFGRFYKAIPEPRLTEVLESEYKRLTGKNVYNSSSNKKDKGI